MYNGNQPPPRPPFAPNFAPPQNGFAPTQFPPFAPPPGFIPPFPPTYPSGGPVVNPQPFGMRPPLSAGAIPPRPSHPGLGLPTYPSFLPTPPHSSGSSPAPTFVRDVKTTSVFVGSIAPGVSDQTLRDLLNACGPLHDLKRPTGASGKPQAFGFAQIESPEVVMRCIRCLNGVELPDMTPGSASKPAKALVVKVDDKTREFLEEFEQTLGRSDDDEAADAICRKSIAHIIALLTDPNAVAPTDIDMPNRPRSPISVIVPAHLQDLKEGDLPEEQRTVVLDQIAIFRENSARREREKKMMEDEKERFKAMEAREAKKGSQQPIHHPGATSAYGYGNRALSHTEPKQAQHSPANGRVDPQGYSQPVAFVKPQAPENKGESERTDEEEHELRRQRSDRDRNAALRDRERRVETRERQRIENLNRDMGMRRQQADQQERHRVHLMDLLEHWDDDEKIERGRDFYYADRVRWRAQRQQARNREYQEDMRDRHREEEEQRALEQESEDFLKKQLLEMSELENKQRQAGLLSEDAVPIRLALNAAAEVKEEIIPAKPKPTLTFDGDDEEDEAAKKKTRTLVKLEYDGDGLTEAERLAKRNARLLEIRAEIPRDRRQIWASRIEWAAINESVTREKIRPFVQREMKHLLGEVDQDLVAFVLDHLRAKGSPNTLVEGLEPVFAEDATSFVLHLWRQLAFETAAYIAGLDTGSMMV